jgi:hypothetical protein
MTYLIGLTPLAGRYLEMFPNLRCKCHAVLINFLISRREFDDKRNLRLEELQKLFYCAVF